MSVAPRLRNPALDCAISERTETLCFRQTLPWCFLRVLALVTEVFGNLEFSSLLFSVSVLSLYLLPSPCGRRDCPLLGKGLEPTTLCSVSAFFQPRVSGYLQPKTGWSWWTDLTECDSLEKGMTNHFSILALRTL